MSQTIILLCMISVVIGATLPSAVTTEETTQKKISSSSSTISNTANAKYMINHSSNDKHDENESKAERKKIEKSTKSEHEPESTDGKSSRRDKMLDYRFLPTAPTLSMPYYPSFYSPYFPQPYAAPVYQPYVGYPTPISVDQESTNRNSVEYDDDYTDSNDVYDNNDDGARANTKRRPTKQNSPIFYIRLPPTPYMFIPGLGYVSQPPTIQPMMPQYQVNPFINLPINYLSNAKPTGVYPYTPPQSSTNYAEPQFPSYLPQRPQRLPPYRPMKPSYNMQDSKVTHLKGSYIFNGRPEDHIYLLPNPYQAQYNPYQAQYNPFQAAAALPNPYQAPTPYMNNPYSPIYTPPMPGYY